MPNKMVSGKTAEMRAYGFSGNKQYHFARRYLRPCATRMESGRIIKTTAWGLKPVMMIVNTRRMVAIELREAKNPLVVENKPTKARAKIGRLMSGDKNTLSTVLCQENTGAMPAAMLLKKSPGWKFLEKRVWELQLLLPQSFFWFLGKLHQKQFLPAVRTELPIF